MSSLHHFGALACALILLACSKQGEGERCDLNSGSLDCDVGLICRSADQLSLPGEQRGWALCCPPDEAQPQVDACRAGAELPRDMPVTLPPDAPPAPDAGAPTGDGGA